MILETETLAKSYRQGFGLRAARRHSGPNPSRRQGFGLRAARRHSGPNPSRRQWALRDCTLAVPEGAIVGLVGPNGAGKTTLLQLIVGLLPPTSGTVRVLGGSPDAAMRSGRVGFVAQDAPTYAGLTVADHLNLGAGLNPHRWDAAAAQERVERLGLPPGQRAGRLSGGQRAQLALTLAVSKRPDLLVLDEPVASLDPLARRAFLDETVAASTATGAAVVLSTHLVADLAHTCTHVVVVAGGRLRLAGAIASLCATPADLEGVVLDELGRANDEGTTNGEVA